MLASCCGNVHVSCRPQRPSTWPWRAITCHPVQAEASMFPGMNSGYMTYLVSTTSSLPDFPRSGVSVRRRFRDFVVRLPVTS